MTPEVKKRVRRYGIPIDLVILATGAAMLFGSPSGGTLTVLYLFAVAISAVKLGWRSGLTAAVFGLTLMAFGFGANVSIGNDVAFIALSAAVIGTDWYRRNAERLTATWREQREATRVRLGKAALERASREQLEAAERERQRAAAAQKIEEERQAAEREKQQRAQKIEAERADRERVAALEREKQELAQKLEAEREQAKRDAESSAQERVAALEREKQELAQKLEAEREQAKRDAEKLVEERLAAERAELQKKYEQQLREAAAKAAPQPQKPAAHVPAEKPSVFSSLSSWLKTPQRSSKPAVVNLKTKKINGNTTATRRPPTASAARPKPQSQRERRPRILMLERRRGTADAVAPRLRDIGIDVQIVERWIDGVDEIFRFRPDAIFVDAEIPDFNKVHKSIVEQAPRLPIFVTAGSHGALPNVPRAASVIRPYNAEAVAKLARESMTAPQVFLERQVVRSSGGQPPSAVQSAAPRLPKPQPAPAPQSDEKYDVVCFNCRVAFDATDADWCSCLTKERTLVCTNCLTCFCKAPPSYKEKFWVEAPPRLFERKTAELRKQQGSLEQNVVPEQVKRPLVMLVEDDEDIQTIVHRVCSNLGYGFVAASNGQDGLNLARDYKPNLILSDAFMPKLDGREMCRILKEESVIPDCKMIVMTGLYTDTKYKTEALKRFHIDDYLSKPVSITDLINLLQKHLEGVTGSPAPEDLFEVHRKDVEHELTVEDFVQERGIPLAEMLEAEQAAEPESRLPIATKPMSQAKTYEICCFTCGKIFDATQAEWCTCLGRDQTLVCPHCSTCFCKSPAAYKERFWMDAPSMLFERKMIGSKRSVSGKNNPSPMEVKRPLILLVEDDENIQLIVKTVVTSMGYGFIVGANGQEGLAMAREYNPDLILSDAFMPKLDGREMCRLLKEDPATARAKAIIMTGLYTDRKYRNEALSYFKVDDYVAKPVAVDDLIKLMKKHLPQEVQPTM